MSASILVALNRPAHERHPDTGNACPFDRAAASRPHAIDIGNRSLMRSGSQILLTAPWVGSS